MSPQSSLHQALGQNMVMLTGGAFSSRVSGGPPDSAPCGATGNPKHPAANLFDRRQRRVQLSCRSTAQTARPATSVAGRRGAASGDVTAVAAAMCRLWVFTARGLER